ncbi:serine hydrolase domain-containing protein [Streptomyces sp. NRRL WC-3742]|uniref:serine hydrolase domain-containing protein n=1 Tax=Streptomyces sp. NRRL WC-3742 TaxID=1463934 RepID=UPI0004CBB3E2|nr:serine hydrolase domain-containing protein [Streptomyces sp. NRRL WC-3742]
MKTTVRTAISATVTATVTAALLASAPAAFAVGEQPKGNGHAGVQAVLDRAVTEAGLPGARAEVRDGDSTWFGTAGTADRATGRVMKPQDRFRIGSTTKTFVSTVVLQLAAEQRLSLDDSVERWLPGLLDGNGYDGSGITVRQLLNHTSGVFNYVGDPELGKEFVGTPFLQHRFDDFTPRQLVEVAVANGPVFAPGTGFAYSDTNYALAGMIVEQVTGRSLAQEITARITGPLHLRSTYVPAAGDMRIHGPHARHYSQLMATDVDTAPSYDVTDLNPSWGYASGDMISTSGDLNTFFRALLEGRLLPQAQQNEMFTMLDPGVNWIKDSQYGLGVASQKLSCTTVWGMGGAINGSWSYTFGSRDGRHLLSTEVNGDWAKGPMGSPIGVFTHELEAEFCPAAATS